MYTYSKKIKNMHKTRTVELNYNVTWQKKIKHKQQQQQKQEQQKSLTAHILLLSIFI